MTTLFRCAGTGLLGAIVLLLITHLLQLMSGNDSRPNDFTNIILQEGPYPASDRAVHAPVQTNKDFYIRVISSRPLFSETRRPLEKAPQVSKRKVLFVPQAQPEIVEIRVEIYGTIVQNKKQRVLLSINDAPERWYRLNDLIEGWELTEITESKITLEQGGKTLRINKKRP